MVDMKKFVSDCSDIVVIPYMNVGTKVFSEDAFDGLYERLKSMPKKPKAVVVQVFPDFPAKYSVRKEERLRFIKEDVPDLRSLLPEAKKYVSRIREAVGRDCDIYYKYNVADYSNVKVLTETVMEEHMLACDKEAVISENKEEICSLKEDYKDIRKEFRLLNQKCERIEKCYENGGYKENKSFMSLDSDRRKIKDDMDKLSNDIKSKNENNARLRKAYNNLQITKLSKSFAIKKGNRKGHGIITGMRDHCRYC